MGKAIVATHCVPDALALTEQLTHLQFGEPSYYLLHRADAITDWKTGDPGRSRNRSIHARQIIWE